MAEELLLQLYSVPELQHRSVFIGGEDTDTTRLP